MKAVEKHNVVDAALASQPASQPASQHTLVAGNFLGLVQGLVHFSAGLSGGLRAAQGHAGIYGNGQTRRASCSAFLLSGLITHGLIVIARHLHAPPYSQA